MSKVVAAAVAGAVTLTSAGGLTMAKVLDRNDVTISIDGVSQQTKVKPGTVAQALEAQGIKVNSHDSVQPSLGTRTADGTRIAVNYGRKLNVNVDGSKVSRWTTARSVDTALRQLNLDDPLNVVSVSRSAGISRKGLDFDVKTAKDVTITAKGKQHKVKLVGTVGDALKKAGVQYDSDDEVNHGLNAPLTKGMAITWAQIDKKQTTKKVSVGFDKKSVTDSSMTKGDTEITTKGVNGENVETWVMTYKDGKLVAQKKTATKQTKAPVTQVTKVGTKAPKTSSSSGGDSPLTSGSSCQASTYGEGDNTAGGPTASGETFNPSAMTAAHKTLPLGSVVKVTNQSNGKTVTVRINDRGPYIAGRCLDLSTAAMNAIGGDGVASVYYAVQ
ncbi:septal ring lytic transglycosylase RlpA family protein [Acidipropionibacterium acidipropionici]|uniref:septal ring lytic transglycosylase RlpA family protein n=1 Tax=Acidipropionibacterium acidipropionici TaxID=1748 RepID=UPI00110B9E8F|nr:septal ring lytic transglycosylase RlpA family protein [Acidipropionibacterium acidipropionici]QCV96068.1 septal ring lytic transglycosylase RlpA family protein [Acidipropionibacterium acidipropionici]